MGSPCESTFLAEGIRERDSSVDLKIMSALAKSHESTTLREFLDRYLDVIDALAITTENIAKMEQTAGTGFDQNMFSSAKLVKLLTSSPSEEVGKLFKFLIEIAQYSASITNLAKLSIADKETLSRNLKQTATKYRK